MPNPIDIIMGRQTKEPEISPEEKQRLSGKREDIRQKLKDGELEDTYISVEVEESAPQLELGGTSISVGDMMGGMMPKRTKMRRMKVKDARKILIEEEPTSL